jgi:hypothetical protein
MATPKEQHDARSNARHVGHLNARRPPADAMPAADTAGEERRTENGERESEKRES